MAGAVVPMQRSLFLNRQSSQEIVYPSVQGLGRVQVSRLLRA